MTYLSRLAEPSLDYKTVRFPGIYKFHQHQQQAFHTTYHSTYTLHIFSVDFIFTQFLKQSKRVVINMHFVSSNSLTLAMSHGLSLAFPLNPLEIRQDEWDGTRPRPGTTCNGNIQPKFSDFMSCYTYTPCYCLLDP